jgi:hypothetical protein
MYDEIYQKCREALGFVKKEGEEASETTEKKK